MRNDLFGEQLFSCGGLGRADPRRSKPWRAAYHLENGLFRVLRTKSKLIVDLIYEGGIANMNYSPQFPTNRRIWGEYVPAPPS